MSRRKSDGREVESGIFSPVEYEAAMALLQLRVEIEPRTAPFRVYWGSKRRRSYRITHPSQSATTVPFQPPPSGACHVEQQGGSSEEVRESSSPDTPLVFPNALSSSSPSQSDGMRKKPPPKKKSKEMEEYAEIIKSSTRHTELLKRELDKVRRFYCDQWFINREIQIRAQHLHSNGEMQLSQPAVRSFTIQLENHCCDEVHQQPSITDRTVHEVPSTSADARCSSYGQMTRADPRGIPDLNAPALDDSHSEEAPQPLDQFTDNEALTRSMAAAAARQRRRLIINRSKNPNTSNRPPRHNTP